MSIRSQQYFDKTLMKITVLISELRDIKSMHAPEYDGYADQVRTNVKFIKYEQGNENFLCSILGRT